MTDETISTDEALRRLRERLEQGPTSGEGEGTDYDTFCYGCDVDFRDISDLDAHLQKRCLPDGYQDRLELWHTPLTTAYQRHERKVRDIVSRTYDRAPLLYRVYHKVQWPVGLMFAVIQQQWNLHTLKGIALEDYRIYVEDYEHWMSGSWESYMEEKGYL